MMNNEQFVTEVTKLARKHRQPTFAFVQQVKEFKRYCWSFYGPEGLYSEIFHHNLEASELNAPIVEVLAEELRQHGDNYDFDSFLRETVKGRLMISKGI